jgi:hypothetical protein
MPINSNVSGVDTVSKRLTPLLPVVTIFVTHSSFPPFLSFLVFSNKIETCGRTRVLQVAVVFVDTQCKCLALVQTIVVLSIDYK